MHYYCTYFDSNCLTKGLAMLYSLHNHDKKYQIYVVCLDKQVLQIMEALSLPNVRLIPLQLIENKNPELRTAKKDRSTYEYTLLLTPVILKYLLQAVSAGSILMYLDAELYFFSDVDSIFQELDGASIFIQSCSLSPKKEHLCAQSKHNTEIIAFRNDAEAISVLEWWKLRCLEYTGQENIQTADGLSRFGNQKYLDYFQDISQAVRVSQNPGFGVAPWNVGEFTLSTSPDGIPLVDGSRVIFYHFQSFSMIAEGCASPALPAYPLSAEALRLFVAPYFTAVERALDCIRRVAPSFPVQHSLDAARRGGGFMVRKERCHLLGEVADKLIPVGGSWGDDLWVLPASVFASSNAPATEAVDKLIKYFNTYTQNPRLPRLLHCGHVTHWHPDWMNVDASPIHKEVVGIDLRSSWPIPDGFFDMVYHSHTLEYASDDEDRQITLNCWNALKSGGILRVLVPVSEHAARTNREHPDVQHQMYDAISLEKLLRSCGFTEVHVVRADESARNDFASFNLDTEPDGTVRKPGVLIMEARKPEHWQGDYKDWASAVQAADTKGYAAEGILEKVRSAALAVRDGKALWERDSVLFYNEEFNQPLFDRLMQVAADADGKLHVLDFGGSLGSTCVQHRRLLNILPEWTWNVVEQPHFVACGKQELQTDQLRFFASVEEALAAAPINVVLLSGVLQYLEDSYAMLQYVSALPVSWLFIDRTPALDGHERIVVQNVPPQIYNAAYPCRFLNKQRLEEILQKQRNISEWFQSAADPAGFYGVTARRKI